MDKSCQSSADSTITSSSSNTTVATAAATTNNNRDHYLKHLNKISHKISKPTTTIKKPPFDPPFNTTANSSNNNQPNQLPSQQQQQQNQNLQGQQHQPPVYNINKNDFRNVVQKLTGSPAHERFSTPPPIHQPKPQSSRLQRIRPPPLAHVSNRPPPLINSTIPLPQQPHLNTGIHPNTSAAAAANTFIQRPTAPLSPLPPFPAVHAAAESPVSAYMRYLQNTISAVDSNKQFSGFSPLAPLASPRWNNPAAAQQQFPVHQQLQQPAPSTGMIAPQPQFPLPTSPLPFGCLNSPRSPYALLSPSSFPLSPTVPSPSWRGL